MRYPADLLRRLAALAEADPAREVCGLVVGGAGGPMRLVPFANAAGPRAAVAYQLDPLQLLRVLRDLAVREERVIAVYHSHPGGRAELSHADRAEAAAGGAPLWPGVEQLVVAVDGGRAGDLGRYRFTDGDYRRVSLD